MMLDPKTKVMALPLPPAWFRALAGLSISGVLVAACVLNPQPLPPEAYEADGGGGSDALPVLNDGGARDGWNQGAADGPFESGPNHHDDGGIDAAADAPAGDAADASPETGGDGGGEAAPDGAPDAPDATTATDAGGTSGGGD